MTVGRSMRGIAAMALAALSLLPATGRADRALDKLIDAGVRCYQELNYGCAITRLTEAEAAMAGGKSTTAERALLSCRTLAFALASVEKHDDAATTFERCFAVDPTFRLDPKVISPKIYADYQTARKKQLGKLIRGGIEPPPVPAPYPPPALGADEMVAHVPAGLTTGAALRDDGQLDHQFGVSAGVRVLFGNDAEDFSPGFAVGLDYVYDLTGPLQLIAGLAFSQHGTARDDIKVGFPASLTVLEPGVGLRLSWAVGEWVDLSTALMGGVTLAGLGGVGDTTAGMVAVRATVTIKATREFGVGLSVIPTMSVTTLSNGELGASLSLPLVLRFEAHF